MGIILRHLDAKSKFPDELGLEVIANAIPPAAIDAAAAEGAPDQGFTRKLSRRTTLLLCIAMNLYSQQSMAEVMRKLARGLRLLFGDSEYALPTDSAICQRRYQLGPRPLVALFRRVCRPMATPQTQGAFLFGLRLMGIDGTKENVPDTPANAAAFGRTSTDGRQGAFPQVLGIYLVELGTHAIVDAGFWGCHTSEALMGLRLLRSVRRGMLLMWDRGYHSFEMVRQTLARGAHFLGRMPAGAKPKLVRILEDGTRLVQLHPNNQVRCPGRKRKRRYPRGHRPKPVLVRLIEYTITDPGRTGHGEKHRLITSLLNPRRYPAKELICAYHQRWEVEVTIDEMQTHQRLAGRTLRSLLPTGVIQELYGLLLAHYAVRSLMHAAALQADVDPDRMSFTHSLEVIRDGMPEFQQVAPEQHPWLYGRLLRDIAAKPLPPRRPRINPRVVKRQQSSFPVKRKESWPGYRKHPPFEDVVYRI